MARNLKKILIIGDDSYFAQNFIDKFGGKYAIIGLGNKPVGYNVKNYRHYDFDLLKEIPDNLPGVDIIIHIASIADAIFCDNNRESCFGANVLKTLEICQWAKENKVKKYIYISTGSVYKGQDKELEETDECFPGSFYAWTKYCAELAILRYKECFDVAILRLFSPYGPKTHPDRVINRIIKKVDKNQAVELNNDSRPKISPLYIDDLIQALELAIRKNVNGEIINIGGEHALNIEELAKRIGIILDKDVRFIRTKKEVGSLYCSNKKAKKILGFEPQTELKEGINKTINYYKNGLN